MSLSKIACITLATAAVLSMTSVAQADTRESLLGGGYSLSTKGIDFSQNALRSPIQMPAENKYIGRGERYVGSSETASFFYQKGARKLTEGKLDQAKKAFEATLRADGSKTLDKLSLFYLAHINYQQGDTTQAQKYARAYDGLSNA